MASGRWVRAFVVAAVFTLLGSVARGQLADGVEPVLQVALGAVIVAATRFLADRIGVDRLGRLLGTASVWIVAVLAIRAVLAVVAPVAWPLPGSRLTIPFENANLSAAMLVVVGTVGMLSGSTRHRHALYVLVPMMVLLTGSRTAVFAVAVAVLATWWLHERPIARPRAAIRAMLGLAAACSTFLLLTALPANLLTASNKFEHVAWDPLASELVVDPQPRPAPDGSATARAILARADVDGSFPAILLTQSLGPSLPGAWYVASVYSRADVPTAFAIGSGLAVADCLATAEWSRCETPAAQGDGERSAQFQLRSRDIAQPLAIELWAPQLERARVATSPKIVDDRFGIVGSLSALRRLEPTSWLLAPAVEQRGRGLAVAVEAFQEHPIAGVGAAELELRFEESATRSTDPGHAHNHLLQTAAAYGVLGLFAWLVPLVAFVASARGYGRVAALVLVATVSVLNLTDGTYAHVGSYVPMWAGLAWASLVQGRRVERLTPPAPTPLPPTA